MAGQLLQRKHRPASESVKYQLLCIYYFPIFSHPSSIEIDAKDVRTLFAPVFTEDSFQNYVLLPKFDKFCGVYFQEWSSSVARKRNKSWYFHNKKIKI